MTFEEYLDHRKNKTFTPGEVTYLLEKCGYRYKFMDTLIEVGKYTWVDENNKDENNKNDGVQRKAMREISRRNENEVPRHFAYIKFYNTDRGDRFALVAGKTNFESLDFRFEFVKPKENVNGDNLDEFIAKLGKDKAKVWMTVKKREKEYDWYCQQVLAVWEKGMARKGLTNSQQGNQAQTVERDIGGLFGLFYS